MGGRGRVIREGLALKKTFRPPYPARHPELAELRQRGVQEPHRPLLDARLFTSVIQKGLVVVHDGVE